MMYQVIPRDIVTTGALVREKMEKGRKKNRGTDY